MSGLSAEERAEFSASVRNFLTKQAPEQATRAAMETWLGFDPAVWDAMSKDLGLQAIAIPEAFGGAGFSFLELGAVLEEMGRSLLCAPYLSSVVFAANLLLTSDDEVACAEYLPGIASGASIGAVAISEDFTSWRGEATEMQARREGGQWILDGVKTLVLDGCAADLVVVLAQGEVGPSLFAVTGDPQGLSRTALDTLDHTRKLARLEFAGVPARLVGQDGDGARALSKTLDLVGAALALEAVGGARRCLEMAVEHAKTRIQFGKPIGSFQAIQHKCAELLVEIELAKSAADIAMGDAAGSPADLAVSAPMAKAFCADTYCRAALDNIQIHGGMGFTWDHPAHLYYRRAQTIQSMMGDSAYHREQLARRLEL